MPSALRRLWRALLPCLAAALLVALCTIISAPLRHCVLPTTRLPPRAPTQPAVSTAAAAEKCIDTADTKEISCLQQALWGKCGQPFMSGCAASCGRCASEARLHALTRTVLVSARQPSPCAAAGADAWVMRSMQNHAEFARAHGMSIVWSSALVDASYEGAWNKCALLLRVLRAELARGVAMWILWVDWDAVLTDLAFELPLEEYERRRVRLVIGGDPGAIGHGQPRADYLKANTGVMLMRVHNWTVALLSRMLVRGGRTKAQRRRHALEVQEHVANLCVGCIDDQGARKCSCRAHDPRTRTPPLLSVFLTSV